MKNTKHNFLQQRIQQRRSISNTGFESDETDFPMTPGRKKFLDLLERMKQESLETGIRWEGPH